MMRSTTPSPKVANGKVVTAVEPPPVDYEMSKAAADDPIVEDGSSQDDGILEFLEMDKQFEAGPRYSQHESFQGNAESGPSKGYAAGHEMRESRAEEIDDFESKLDQWEEHDELDGDEPSQLQEIAEDDQPFFDILVVNLKECIDEPVWTSTLWKSLFASEYGWEADSLLDKYLEHVIAAVPTFGEKLDLEAALAEADIKPKLGGNQMPSSSAFYRILEELKAWDWSNPHTTQVEFAEAYQEKYGNAPRPLNILWRYRSVYKKLVPAYAKRMQAKRRRRSDIQADSIARSPTPASSAAPSEPEEPVRTEDRWLFELVARALREYDWSHPAASYSSWKSRFASTYGCSSQRILAEYGDLLLELCPEFAAHRPTNLPKVRGEAVHPQKVKHKHVLAAPQAPASRGPQGGYAKKTHDEDGIALYHRPLFDIMVEDLRSRDWSKPFYNSQWLSELGEKYGSSFSVLPKTIGSLYASQLKRFVPEYATRLKYNRGKMPMDADGIKLADRPLFDLVIEDLKSQDWSQPFLQSQWILDFKRKHGQDCPLSTILAYYGPQIRAAVPEFAKRMALNRSGRAVRQHSQSHGSQPSGDQPSGSQPSSSRHHDLTAQVTGAYRDLFDRVVTAMNAFDWSCEGEAVEQFIQEFTRHHPRTNLIRLIGQYGTLLRRACPGFAARMNADRMLATTRSPRRQRQLPKLASPRGDSELLSRSPSRSRSPARPSYAPPPRRMGPLSFPSALAALEVESYRHQSSQGGVNAQLPKFCDFLGQTAKAQYERMVGRVQELDTKIESGTNDLRALAKEVDQTDSALKAQWATLRADADGMDEDDDAGREAREDRLQDYEDRQQAAVARRCVLMGHRAHLEKLYDERASILGKVRSIDEAVVVARAKIQAALMDE